MSPELVAGLVALVVSLIGGSVGWQQIGAHGEKRAELKRAKEDIRAAEARAERAEVAPASRAEASGILRRRLDRIAKRLRKARGDR